MIGPGRSRWKIDEHSQEAEREEAQLSEERISQGLIEEVDNSVEWEENYRVKEDWTACDELPIWSSEEYVEFRWYEPIKIAEVRE